MHQSSTDIMSDQTPEVKNEPPPYVIRPDIVAKFISILEGRHPGGRFESRILNAQFGGKKIVPGKEFKSTFSMWGRHQADFFNEASRLGVGVSAYLIPNPVDPAKFRRLPHEYVLASKTEDRRSTNDDDILAIKWVYIDIDSVRKPGSDRKSEISATDEELSCAIALRDAIIRDEPELLDCAMWGISGNGCWMLIPIDLSNDEDGRRAVADVLLVLADRYGNNHPGAKIDTVTKNPARLMPLPGTMKCKGGHTAERPWRPVTLAHTPPQIVPCDIKDWLRRNPPPPTHREQGAEAIPSRPKARTDGGSNALIPYVTKAVEEECQKVAETLPGARNNTLNIAAVKVGGFIRPGVFTRPEAEAALTAAGLTAGLELPEIQATIRSGLDAGERQPRDLSSVGRSALQKRLVKEHGKHEPSPQGPHRSPQSNPSGQDVPTASHIEEDDDDPHRLALAFTLRRNHKDERTLLYWQQEIYRWGFGKWTVFPSHELRAELASFIKAEFDALAEERAADQKGNGDQQPIRPQKVSTRLISDVIQALQGEILLPWSPSQELPAWIRKGPEGWKASDILACRNSLVHLPSLVEGREGAVMPATPRLFAPQALDFNYEPTAPPPATWCSFLESLWPDDPESITLLQEWFGYCLTPDTSRQKALFLIGPTGSGKGTIIRILTALVGPGNVSTPTLGSFDDPFGLAPLIGKTLVVFSDARISRRSDQATIVERLLAIIGEDSQSVNRKHRTAWEGRLTTRFMLASNELPHLDETSGALAARLLWLRLTRTFRNTEAEDNGLGRKLDAERPGILNWAIRGYARLREQNRFTQPSSAADLSSDMAELSAPIQSFVAEQCEIGRGEEECKRMFDAWREWCEGRNESPGGAGHLGRKLKAAFPSIRTTGPTTRPGSSKPIRLYQGIRLRGVLPS